MENALIYQWYEKGEVLDERAHNGQINKSYKCKTCKKSIRGLRGSTSNLRKHFSSNKDPTHIEEWKRYLALEAKALQNTNSTSTPSKLMSNSDEGLKKPEIKSNKISFFARPKYGRTSEHQKTRLNRFDNMEEILSKTKPLAEMEDENSKTDTDTASDSLILKLENDDDDDDDNITDNSSLINESSNSNSNSASNNKKKKSNNLWSYFKIINNKEASCTLCNAIVKTSGNSSNISMHIKRKHPQVSTNSDPKWPLLESNRNETFNSPIITKVISDEELTDKICYMLIKDVRPISTVEGEGFRRLIHFMKPSYAIPNREKITERIKEIMEDQIFEL